jgi:crossover junction endodeoxyribonuclease RuvC
MPKNNKISIGLDLSLVGTGIVVIDDNKIILQQLIKSKPSGDKPINELRRIESIVERINEILQDYTPTLAVIENLAFMARNTVALTQLAGLNYFVRSTLAIRGIPFYLCAPTTLKKFATGKGNCPKDNIMMEVYKHWHVTITNNNLADGFILARIGQCLLGVDSKLTIPQKEVITLLKKQWTEPN